MSAESTEARLARIDERSAATLQALAELRVELATREAKSTQALREHESRMVERIEQVRATTVGEVYSLKQDKDREHAELRRGQDRLAVRIGAVEDWRSEVRGITKGITKGIKIAYAVGGAGGATAILAAITQVIGG